MKRDLSNRRFFDFFRSSNSTADARKAPKTRDLRVESLEERQLLSATPCEIAPELAEISAVGSIANVADSSPATWLVSLTDDDVEMRGTLRHALANAEAGDVVQFASSLRSETITLDGTELIVDKAITIDASNLWDAENNAPGLTISANNASRVFDIRSDAELNGLSITAGNARYGGGIYAYQVSLTLRNCSISNNVAIGEISDGRVYGGYGGGVYAAFCGETTFENCLFANNSAIYGGGVYVDCEVATFNNCLITNNSSDYDGGGAWVGCADATFNNCSITNNSSDYNGGGVELRCDNVGTFENCSISNNISKRNGGGVCFLRGDLSMSNCLISENSALSGAGVSLYKMYSAYDVTGTFNSCSIVDNIGAGIGTIFEVSSFTLTNCTLAGNSYGISDYNCGGTIRNSIVAGNETDFYDSAIVNGYNTLSSFTNWSNKSQPDVVNYLYDPTSPLFVDPENGDYRLAPNVQAIDRGDNQYVSGTTDLAGNLRIVASLGSDPVVDLGAYEYQETIPFETPSIIVNTEEDVVDRLDDKISLREALVYANPGDAITFADSLKGKTITLDGSQLTVDKAIAIDAWSLWDDANDAPGLTISGNGASRVFSVGANASFKGLRIVDGAADNGAGISANNANLTVENCVFESSAATGQGGAIYVNGGTFSFEGATFENNSANGDGSAIYTNSSSGSIVDSNFSNNTTNSGATAKFYNTSVAVDNAFVENNYAKGYVGAFDFAGNSAGAVCSVSNSRFFNNRADSGAGCLAPNHQNAESITIVDSYFEGNSTGGRGGALFIGCNTYVARCQFVNNDAQSGGAFHVLSNGVLSTTDCVFSGNSAQRGGAGYNEGVATIENCEIVGNDATLNSSASSSAYSYGGGMYSSGTLTMIDSAISSNAVVSSSASSKAYSYGGGIYSTGNSTLTNCKISANCASSSCGSANPYAYGGGVYSSGTLTATNCEISANYTAASASGNYSKYFLGGGAYVNGGSATFSNCTIAGNSAATSGGVYGTATFNNAIVATNYGGDGVSSAASNNFIGGDPCFVVAPQFDENGVLQNADQLDLRLTQRSWAIDSGDNQCASGLTTDLAGNPRIVASVGADEVVDIGAYEYQTTISVETPSIIVNTEEDSFDRLDNKISLREALSYAEDGDAITFADSLKGKTITLGGAQLTVNKAIAIDARSLWDDVNDAPGLTISGNGASRVIDAAADLSLYGLTITGGSNRGVSVNGTDSDLTIADCVFRENVGNGPAVEVWGASVNVSNSSFIDNNSNNDPGAGILIGCPGTVSNCSFVGNSAGSNMGGGATVYLLGDVAFENCSFVENSAGSGGAVCVVNSSEFEASFVDCSFENNAATYYGGAAHIYSGGNGRFVNCSFNGNATSYDSGYGGAVCVYNSGSNGTFESCSFKNNSSGTATVMSAYEGSATLTNCEIVGTVKKNDNYWHGGYFNLQGSGALVNCAISGNRYGIVQQNGTTNVYNSIIAGNDTDVSPSGTLNAYNTLSTFVDWTNAETGVRNFRYSPTLSLFADPESGDYRLDEDSQAVDLGDNSFAVGQTDLDGNPRVARTVDLGPYELNDSRLSPPAITGVSTAKKSVTFKINAVDGATSYRVEYSTDPTFETFSYKNYATTGAKTIAGLDYGTTYYFRVKASANGVVGSGLTFFNAKTKNETFSDAPTLALVEFDYNAITVDIGAVPNAGEYLVQYSPYASFEYFYEAAFADAGTQTISDLSEGTTYYLRVKATASGYDDSAFSETLEAATRPNETFSAAPTLTFVASGYNSITVDIGAVANAEQYLVQYSTYASFGALSTATFSEAGTQTISNLSPGTTYYLRVKATAPHYDDSAFSETVEVATPVVPEDAFEPNDSLAAAADLGTLTEFYSNDDLTIHVSSDNDWFKFTTVATGGTNDFIRLAHQYSSRVNIDVYLFNESGSAIASSTRSFGLETISLNGLSAGTYYIRVFNYSSAGVAPYSLDIAAPGRSDSDFTPMFVVTTEEDVSDRYDDKISLREALSYARAGESIGFVDSMKGKTITLGGSELTVNRAITVDASNLWDDENDSPGLTIDANGQSRVLNARADLNLRGLTIKGGASAGRGAGIDAEYSSGLKLTVENCVFTDNTADGQGGAVFLWGGGSVFEDCKFDRNSGSSGGAVKIGGSSSNGASFENCLFIDNSAVSFGGAVAVSNDGYSESESYVGDGTFVNCLFQGNAAYSGGAACVYNYGTGAFSNCSFTNNAADGYGGGAFVQLGGSGTFANCSFTEHSNPSVIGGGVCVHGSESTGTFESCSFANNFSKQASVMFHYGSGTLTNCEIVGNSQVVYNDDNDYSLSGGAYFLEGSGSLVNCAIADNTFGILCANSTVNVYNSIVVGNGADVNSSGTINAYNALSTFTNWTNANETGVVNYVYDPNRPLFADPENGDYRLANGSQAVNLGDDSFVVVETDLDGNPRFVGAVDLGPYELQTVVSQLDAPAITGTTTTKVAVTFKINAVANATGYRVEYGTDPNFETFAFKNYTSAGAKTISGLDFGTTYYFRVKATADGYDDSDWTTFEAATKKEALSGAPTLTAASVGFDSVVLAIGTVANAEQYVVEYDTSDAFSAPTPVPFDAAGNATVSNLASNTTYCFRVKAIAPRYDDSAWSETVVATTLDPSAVPLDVPTIAALSGTKTAIVVKLEGVADAQKYVVEYATDASFSNASSKT